MDQKVKEVALSLAELLRSIEINPQPKKFYDQISEWMGENIPKMNGDEFRNVALVTVQMCEELSRPEPTNLVAFALDYRSRLEGIIAPQNLN